MPAARAPGVRRCIASYQLSGEAPAGYALDVGVLSDGRAALVEVNEGYAIGFYDKVPGARRRQLVAARCALRAARWPAPAVYRLSAHRTLLAAPDCVTTAGAAQAILGVIAGVLGASRAPNLVFEGPLKGSPSTDGPRFL